MFIIALALTPLRAGSLAGSVFSIVVSAIAAQRLDTWLRSYDDGGAQSWLVLILVVSFFGPPRFDLQYGLGLLTGYVAGVFVHWLSSKASLGKPSALFHLNRLAAPKDVQRMTESLRMTATGRRAFGPMAAEPVRHRSL